MSVDQRLSFATKPMRRIAVVFLFASLWTLLSPAAKARVDRIEVLSRADVLDGKAFGDAGPYEKIIGKVHFAVKPDDSHNKFIVDLDKTFPDLLQRHANAAKTSAP